MEKLEEKLGVNPLLLTVLLFIGLIPVFALVFFIYPNSDTKVCVEMGYNNNADCYCAYNYGEGYVYVSTQSGWSYKGICLNTETREEKLFIDRFIGSN